jgi:hypothetical protein
MEIPIAANQKLIATVALRPLQTSVAPPGVVGVK